MKKTLLILVITSLIIGCKKEELDTEVKEELTFFDSKEDTAVYKLGCYYPLNLKK